MHFFTAIRAGILATLPFLYATAQSAQVAGDCGQLVFTTPCLAAPLADNGLLAAVLAAGYEAVARFLPTARSYSLFTLAGQLLDKVAPNRARSENEEPLQHKTGSGLASYGLA